MLRVTAKRRIARVADDSLSIQRPNVDSIRFAIRKTMGIDLASWLTDLEISIRIAVSPTTSICFPKPALILAATIDFAPKAL